MSDDDRLRRLLLLDQGSAAPSLHMFVSDLAGSILEDRERISHLERELGEAFERLDALRRELA